MRDRRTRVVLAEHQPLIRRALAGLLAENPRLCLEATARDGEEALDVITATRPDVAMIDSAIPGRSPQALLRGLRSRGVESKIIFLTSHLGTEPRAALALEAHGYITTGSDENEICEALISVARGDRAPPRSWQPKPEPDRLSAREIEVLQLAASDRTGQAIAADLWLSPATVRTYLNRIYDKLGVTNRAAAVAKAMRRGLIY